ncbi:MAG: hypothetical protein ABIL49_05390 [candidate division WOR-3 bacterium]
MEKNIKTMILKKLKNYLNRFLELYLEYRSYKLYGAIAGIRITENIRNLADKKGFFIIEHKNGKKILFKALKLSI